MVLIVSAQGTGAPAFANTVPYELYCPGTPVGNIVLNDVVTSGTISPSNPAPGETFQVTDYQTTLELPSSITAAAQALGNSDISGTSTSQIDVSGASPSSASIGTATFDVPIPSPISPRGLELAFPNPAETVGPFTASEPEISITQDKDATLTLEVSGSTLALNCVAHKNNSESTGIVSSGPSTKPIFPVIAVVMKPLSVTTVSLPDARIGQSYVRTLGATGGNPPYVWKRAAGSAELPRGLRLNRRTGVIWGTPIHGDRGTSSITVEVLDKRMRNTPHTQNTATKVLSITIS
jgi:Putative Ig domain